MSVRKISLKKELAMERVKKALIKHKVIAAADLTKVRSTQIQEVRKMLRGRAEILVAKNTIFRMACKELEGERKNILKYAESLNGPFALILTGMNPFELILFLNKNKVKVPAKGGDIATGDIIVPAGNTGLPPGPIISEFGEVKIPTRIESGSIWVTKDTVVARKGDIISAKLASVLTRLGMKPMETGLSLIAAYDGEIILDREMLKLDLEEYRENIVEATFKALNVACEAGYLTSVTALPIFRKALNQASALALAAEYITPETINPLLRAAYLSMMTLNNIIAMKNPEAA
ncbi:50S ribosomal protein L10 [Candidatus Bathyarchaeota archaeon]|nr:50S ribosomal protein L10 [Candidatus Bathyarchaeota archaeon]